MCTLQIYASLKGKVAVDGLTLSANLSMKCHGNTISRFHLIANYVSSAGGGKFSQEIIFCDTCRIPA